jgi:hypothetical protein
MSRELFIYWRLRSADLAAAIETVRRFQAGLGARCGGLAAGLYQRHHAGGVAVTLMETYRIPGGVGPALEAEIVADGDLLFAPWCVGERHVEAFERLSG